MARLLCRAGGVGDDPARSCPGRKDPQPQAVIDVVGLAVAIVQSSGQKLPFRSSDWQELARDGVKCPTLFSVFLSTLNVRLAPQSWP